MDVGALGVRSGRITPHIQGRGAKAAHQPRETTLTWSTWSTWSTWPCRPCSTWSEWGDAPINPPDLRQKQDISFFQSARCEYEVYDRATTTNYAAIDWGAGPQHIPRRDLVVALPVTDFPDYQRKLSLTDQCAAQFDGKDNYHQTAEWLTKFGILRVHWTLESMHGKNICDALSNLPSTRSLRRSGRAISYSPALATSSSISPRHERPRLSRSRSRRAGGRSSASFTASFSTPSSPPLPSPRLMASTAHTTSTCSRGIARMRPPRGRMVS